MNTFYVSISMLRQYFSASIIFIFSISAYLLQTNFFLIPCLILAISRRLPSLLILVLCVACSVLIVSQGGYRLAQFIFYTSLIIFISDKYRFNYWILLNIFSIGILFFFIVCLFSPQNYFTIKDVLTFKARLWPVILERQVNPNFIGMLAFLGVVNYLHRKQYLMMFLMIIFVVLSQSRAVLVLVVFIIIFSRPLRIGTLFTNLFFMVILFMVVSQGTFLDRIQNDADNGRLFLFSMYLDALGSSFPFPVSKERTMYIGENYGPLDNLYLRVVVDYGIVGAILLLLPIFFVFKSQLWRHRFEFVFFLSFYLLGFVESSYLNNATILIAFSGLLKFQPYYGSRVL